MANLEHPKGTQVTTAVAATEGDYLHANTGAAAIPGRSGPFKEFLLPGMGDSARFNIGPVRQSTGWVEKQLGRYAVQGVPSTPDQHRHYAGPIAGASVTDQLEGWTQALNVLAAEQANTIHEIATLKVSRFWINQIKSEAFQPFNGWEDKVTIFRGGLLHQSGLHNWRRIMTTPLQGINHPSTFPGFETIMGTTEELTGVGYETGWGSDSINIDHLRNVPNAPQQIKEILDMGVDQAIALRESYNRETYVNLTSLMHRAFVMCCDCQPTEDVGSRIFIYDPHVAPDAFQATTGDAYVGKMPAAGTTGSGADGKIANGDWIALVDDRAAFTNEKVPVVLNPSEFVDPYGQYHAQKAYVTDPTTGMPAPFALVDAGPAGSAYPVEPLNFDMLERLTDELQQRCPEAAVGSDGDAPIFAITVKHDDIDKLVRATPIEWDAWRRAEPQALISHYGISKAKTYRRWAIVNDTNQLRFKPIAYISNYDSTTAAKFGFVGYRDGDDTGLQGRAVYVCVVVNPKMLSAKRKGTNGYKVPVPNPEYFAAPLALANVFIKDTFINRLEGQAPSIGNGTDFGPLPPCNGQWGFLNVQDLKTNPFRTTGNFYGLLRTHVKPTKRTQDSTCFIYARDMQAFKAFTQAENKIINPDYTGKDQNVAVKAVDFTAKSAQVTALSSGEAFTFTLDTTPHLVLAQGSKVQMAKNASGTLSGNKDFVVLNASRWPQVTLAPISAIDSTALAALGISDTYSNGRHTTTFTGTVVVGK